MPPNFIATNKEYEKNKELKEEDVKAFMEWAHKQPHLPKITELQAILFLQCCYYRNEAAKTALDTFFTARSLCPEMFSNRNPFVSPMKETMNVSVMTPLPKKTPEGYTIFFVRVMDLAAEKYVFPDQFRYFDMIAMMHLYLKGTSKGHLIVFDLQGFTFGHLTRLGPITMKKILFYLQDAMPVRLKGLHFINIVNFMDKILALMKPFMKKELMDVLYLHNTVDDVVKFVPKECLPQEYGGSVEAVPIIHEKIKSDLCDNEELFEWEESQRVDESKRPGKPKNEGDLFGVEGTFKKLEID